MTNKKGREVLKEMVKNPSSISIVYSEEAKYELVKDKVQLTLGMTHPNSIPKIYTDENGTPYVKGMTITIYKGSFDILNGDKSKLPKKLRSKEIERKIGSGNFSTEGSLLNIVGIHEGVHSLNDVLEVFKQANNDGIKITERKLIRELWTKLQEDGTFEHVPLEAEGDIDSNDE